MTTHVAIIGGGASSVLTAVHLLRQDETDLRITIVEPRESAGRGVAYSTLFSCHVLNTRVMNMSAFPDDPGHFARWLKLRGNPHADDNGFVAREVYGTYLSGLIDQELNARGGASRLRIIRQECVDLRPHEGGVELTLADGSVLPAHYVVLSTGFVTGLGDNDILRDPWATSMPADPEARVLLVGTGLTMVDMVLSLIENGHKGPIFAMSRRGLLPQTHAPSKTIPLSSADLPMGTSIHYVLHWLRKVTKAHERAGGNWRDVMDGMRPHTQTLWRHLPMESRRRFLRHAASLWENHRHRMPPDSARGVREALESGALTIFKGYFVRSARTERGVEVTYRPAGQPQQETLAIDVAIDCRGVRRPANSSRGRLIDALLSAGQANLDPLRIGLEFDARGALVDREGRASSRIFGVGPITRAQFWEITAVPDIREQAARLAALLASPKSMAALRQRQV